MSNKEQIDLFQKMSFLQPHFIRYLQVGGFPELALTNDDVYAQRILREDIVAKALKRDLPSIYAIRNINDLEKIFLYLCFNSSNIINNNLISKELSINRETIDKYIFYLESANLIYISKSINVSSKQMLKEKNKIYISDAAIRNAVSKWENNKGYPNIESIKLLCKCFNITIDELLCDEINNEVVKELTVKVIKHDTKLTRHFDIIVGVVVSLFYFIVQIGLRELVVSIDPTGGLAWG